MEVHSRPLARGVLDVIRLWVIALGVVVIFVIGFFAPLLGISLLAFLAVDALIGYQQHSRQRTHEPVPFTVVACGAGVAPGVTVGRPGVWWLWGDDLEFRVAPIEYVQQRGEYVVASVEVEARGGEVTAHKGYHA